MSHKEKGGGNSTRERRRRRRKKLRKMPRGVTGVDTVGVHEKGSIWETGETQKHSFNDLQTFVYDFTISLTLLETRKLTKLPSTLSPT